MGDWIFNLVSLLIIIVFIAVYKWIQLSKMKELKNLVAWSVTGDYCPVIGRNSYVHELWMTVLLAQRDVPQEYRVNEKEDFEICHEIIKEYQADIARKYFLDNLSLIKSKYAVSGEDYFMEAFYNFLTDRQCHNEVLGHAMHKERIAYKDYGYGCYNSTYLLSDFGLLYHKLLYITWCYCKNSKAINREGQLALGEHRGSGIKDVLDTKQLEVSCIN